MAYGRCLVHPEHGTLVLVHQAMGQGWHERTSEKEDLVKLQKSHRPETRQSIGFPCCCHRSSEMVRDLGRYLAWCDIWEARRNRATVPSNITNLAFTSPNADRYRHQSIQHWSLGREEDQLI